MPKNCIAEVKLCLLNYYLNWLTYFDHIWSFSLASVLVFTGNFLSCLNFNYCIYFECHQKLALLIDYLPILKLNW